MQIEHHCKSGCCHSPEESVFKVKAVVLKAFTTMAPRKFNKANWNGWMQTLGFFAIGHSMHMLLPRAYHLAFSDGSPYIPGESGLRASAATARLGHDLADLEVDTSIFQREDAAAAAAEQGALEEDEARARAKEELARTRRVMGQFMASNFGAEVHLMRLALDGEAGLMRKLLFSISREAELQSMHAAFSGRASKTRLSQWLDGSYLDEFFTLAWHHLTDPACWAHIPETETMRSRVCMVMMRAVATCHELLSITAETYPFRLFALAHAEERQQQEALAEQVLMTRRCLLDSFTASHLQRHNTVASLLCADSLETLRGLSMLAETQTASTERLHSMNLRKAKQTPMTHRPALESMALRHMSYAGHPVLRPEAPMRPARQGDQKRGRPSKKRALQQAAEVPEAPHKGGGGGGGGGGGSWRAFQSVMLGGQKFSTAAVKDLSQKYRSLSEEERQRFRLIGAQGSLLKKSLLWRESFSKQAGATQEQLWGAGRPAVAAIKFLKQRGGWCVWKSSQKALRSSVRRVGG